MTIVGPDPEQLRESAAALLQMASYLESGRMPHILGSPNRLEAYPPYLLEQIAVEMIEESKQRREIVDLGTFSDPGVSIILAVIASKEKSMEMTANELEQVSGLPSSSAFRLLKELSCKHILYLEQVQFGVGSIRIKLAEDTERHMASYLANRTRLELLRASMA